MYEDDLDAHAVQAGKEKLDHLKSQVGLSSLTDKEKESVAEALDEVLLAIRTTKDTVQLNRLFSQCWSLLSLNEPELAKELEDVASLFGVRMDKRPDIFPTPNVKKRGS